MLISSSELWLLIGVILVILEFSQLPGIGFLFLGLGAIVTSIAINYWPAEIFVQFSYFGIASLACFLVLWYPLKRFIYRKDALLSRESFDLVGASVTVVNKDIQINEDGQVSWSGTIMNARLSKKSKNMAKVGDLLQVVEIKGNILVCDKLGS
ncbi:MAG: NfeD family protein [Rickettsiaceae bacterium]|nr:NfeD family protein [Rickettsiaceae bacterium]